ncbi:hypothetical protein CI238_08812, partial [Colletotrichum incanum]
SIPAIVVFSQSTVVPTTTYTYQQDALGMLSLARPKCLPFPRLPRNHSLFAHPDKFGKARTRAPSQVKSKANVQTAQVPPYQRHRGDGQHLLHGKHARFFQNPYAILASRGKQTPHTSCGNPRALGPQHRWTPRGTVDARSCPLHAPPD